MHLHALHYVTGEAIAITYEAGVITSVVPHPAAPGIELPWVAPALFDLQINGCDGHSFNSPRLDGEAVRHVVAVCRRHGISGLCPTLVTNSFDALAHGFRTLAAACEADSSLARALPVFHLEGPYISPDDGPRGAHPKAHVRPPDWDEFQRLQECAGGRIRLVTLAPEWDGALAFIEHLTDTGIVVALGHTGASGQRIRDAIRAGARLSTHLGNGSHALLPRHDNYLWEQLAADELWASLICDGHHLPPAVIRCLVRAKTPARLILTCDASSLAGLPPGRYGEWDQEFEVRPEGRVVVPGTTFLAGSAAFTDACLGVAMRDGGLSLREVCDMAGAQPRALLGLPSVRLEPGSTADLVLFDHAPGGPCVVRETIGGER